MPNKDPEKHRAYQKEYRREHLTEILAYRKEYNGNHLAEISTRSKKYYEKHQAELTVSRRKYRSTPKGKIICRLCRRLWQELKGKPRAASALELLGCSIEYFLFYIEKQFKPGMTWANYARFGWNLDHIQPVRSFDLSDPEQQKACFHYTNFQPLWWRENLTKRAKYKEGLTGHG